MQGLGDFLLKKGVLSREELAAALRLQRLTRKKLEEVLVEQGYLKEDQLWPLLAEFLQLPLLSLEGLKTSPQLAESLPRSLAQKHNLVPLSVQNGEILLGCAGPVNPAVLENLRRLTGKKVMLGFLPPPELERAREAIYQDAPVEEALPEGEGEVVPEQAAQILDSILKKALNMRASDVHLEPEPEFLRVRFRIDGWLRTVEQLPLELAPPLISRIKVLGRMNIAERRSPQDGGFPFSSEEGGSINVRVSTLPCARGEKAVLRLLPSQEKLLDLEDLGMDEETLARFKELLELPYGLILVTGPTGSGKTFTLYAALKYLRRDTVNIVTVEDPIELAMEGITQTQVDYGSRRYLFSTALRAVLRQDPNIIMVGEIRDGETASLALQAALTGHLVLSTLHTNDAVGAVERLVDMGCERYLVGSALKGVLAQRLVRLICPYCKHKFSPPPGELLALGLSPEEEYYAGRGCPHCHGSGYRGRTGIFELLVLDREIQRLVISGADALTLKEKLKGKMRTLREDGALKVKKGLTTTAEVLKATLEF